jgi:hypothetical protein
MTLPEPVTVAVDGGNVSASQSAGVDTALASALDGIDRTKSGGASLSFTRRNMIETISLHVGLVAFSVALGLMYFLGRDFAVPPVVWGVWGVGALVALIASSLAVRAYRERHTYVRTDRWDGVLGVLQTTTVASVTIWTGGVNSGQWMPVVVGAVYLGSVLVFRSGWAMAALLAALPTITQLAAEGRIVGSDWNTLTMLVGLTVGLFAAFLIVRGVSRSLYDTAEGTGWEQAQLIDQVRRLS